MWQVNDNFRYLGRKYYVKGIDVEGNYQSEYERTYLRYTVKEKGKWMDYWVDSERVEKLAKPRNVGSKKKSTSKKDKK